MSDSSFPGRCQVFWRWWFLSALADGPFDRGLSLALDRLLRTLEEPGTGP